MKIKHLLSFRFNRCLVLIPASFLLLSCSSNYQLLCPFGAHKGEIQQFDKSYWESTKKNPLKSDRQVVMECNTQSDAEKERLSSAYIQLCKAGHLDTGNRLFVEKIFSDPHYSRAVSGMMNAKMPKKESAESQLKWSVAHSDNPDSFKEYCGYYVTKDAEKRSSTLLGLNVEGFRSEIFNQCMAKNHMMKIVPTKSFRKCNNISW
ncbi:hypothetical protein [Kosakonia cowanii]|uniref:hypothetical protein n=1 Tax=Kosakonia cowanii TaxID=208223 RepID=UPI001F569438|nr:hypothetical protein [Kosakonia cowanii]MDT3410971.1 hypothetical protein [Atlantibacter sp. SORGH_AS_0304]